MFIVFIYLLTENTNITVYELVADPNEVGKVAPYTGLVSTLGILIFAATASVCLFTAYLVKYINPQFKRWHVFLKFSGYFILLLLADDLWQIHESFSLFLFDSAASNRVVQNLGETIIFGFYGLLFSVYLFRFHKLFLQTKLAPLFFTLIFFSLSAIVDIFLENISGHFILEEGLKLLGIVSLAIYYFETCFQQVRRFYFNSSGKPEHLSPQAEQYSSQRLSKFK